jgi:AraC-like DNA-binding protein
MNLLPTPLFPQMNELPAFVPVPEAREHAFAFSRSVARDFSSQWHYHHEVELIWVRRGKGLRYVGRSVEPFEDGDLVLVGPDLAHAWRLAAGQHGSADWSVIQFLPSRWGDAFWQMAETKSLEKLIQRAKGGLRFFGKETDLIGRLIESVAAWPLYSFEALSAFVDICRRLLATESRLLNTGAFGSAGLCPDPRLRRVLALIDTLSNDTMSQAQVAEELKMPSAAFSRWFKRHMGRTFQRYVNEVRVARVCAHLAHEEDKITSVAMDSGYNNLANFYRRFREITGTTPKDFRRQTRRLQLKASNRLLTA